SSRLRYLIHRTVENMELLSSFSVGEGWRRRTVICHSAVRLPGDTRSDPKAGPNAPRGQRPAQPWGRGGRGLRPRQLGDSHGDNARGSVGSGRITRPPRRKPDKALFVARGSRKKANWREREPEGDGPENPVWNSQRERGMDGDSPENPIGNSERGMDGGGPKNLIGKSWRERGTDGDSTENPIGRSWRERGTDGGNPENPIGSRQQERMGTDGSGPENPIENRQREREMDRDGPENPIRNRQREWGTDGDGPENPIGNRQREREMDRDSPENPIGNSEWGMDRNGPENPIRNRQREQGMDGDSPRGVPGKGGSDLGEGGAEHRPCRENAASFGNGGDSREREQREHQDHRDRDWPRSRPADGDERDPSHVPESSVPSEKHGMGRTERGGAELETQNATAAPSLESSGNAEETRRFSMREIHEWENPETSEERSEWSQERFGTGQERFGIGQEEPKPPQNLEEG
ncbi:R3H and coiled-coil domain-containing protein 1-like, partial [Malurus melanocephalus]|uniref:R3H and coiled-coil domain-containing protein 1-like n=1 Tax=Malurus melanocephalus TaxID=175006 RepID=UPI0025466678